MAYLNDIVNSNAITSSSSAAVTSLKEQYENNFRPKVKHLVLDAHYLTDLEDSLAELNTISWPTKNSVVALQEAVLSNTLTNTKLIKKEAGINLLINTLLVSVCMLMSYASFSIVRKIQYQSDHDELTGLPNRRYFNQALASLFKSTDTAGHEKLILMTIDLNGFKSINDTKGYVAGDKLLVQVADRLAGAVANNTVMARMGGDEFALTYKNQHQ